MSVVQHSSNSPPSTHIPPLQVPISSTAPPLQMSITGCVNITFLYSILLVQYCTAFGARTMRGVVQYNAHAQTFNY